ncbi:MAG TPA: PadR family transcriptional regulator [Ktedonobacterales bacterium]|jgi:PadR family transcriptional regulator PadR|nr:PadR family transcriptional regulator [Ktedonobacterales bacterium]
MRELKKGSLGMLLLHLLRERPSYGYELCERLRVRSGGDLSFEDGAIYPLLHEFERQGMVEGYWESGDAGETGDPGASGSGSRKGPRRRFYRLTARGESLLAASVTEWRTFAEAVRRVLAEPNAEPNAELAFG